jgi:hypothetical protein
MEDEIKLLMIGLTISFIITDIIMTIIKHIKERF